MRRSLGIAAALGVTVLPLLLAAAQSPSSGVRSREGFAGNLEILSKGAAELVAVDYRTWFIPEGTTFDDLGGGAGGNLVVEVASGMLTAVIDGQKQPKQFGEFFVVPAGHKLQIVTTNRSRNSAHLAAGAVRPPGRRRAPLPRRARPSSATVAKLWCLCRLRASAATMRDCSRARYPRRHMYAISGARSRARARSVDCLAI